MKIFGRPLISRTDTQHRELTAVEHRLVDMMLKGMGDPLISLQCWKGNSITRHPKTDVVAVYLESRSALWRFLFHPEFALKSDAKEKGIGLADATQFRQVMQKAKLSLPGETVMVNRLLGINTSKTLS